MKSLLKAIIERRIIVVLISAIIIAAGIYAAFTLPVRIQPAIDAPILTVSASVEKEIELDKMEDEVALPLENLAMNESFVKEVRVTTDTKNVSMIVILKDSVEANKVDRLQQDLQQKLNSVNIDLESSSVNRISTADYEFMNIAIFPDNLSNEAVQNEIKDIIVPQLREIGEVRKVSHNVDLYEKKYVFELKEEKVRSLQKATMIAEEVKQSFSSPLLGTMHYGGDDYRVRSEAFINSEEDLVNYRLQTGERLQDLVSVHIEQESDDYFQSMNGKPYYEIALIVSKTASEVEVSKQVREVMDNIYDSKTSAWEYEYIWDGSTFVTQSVKELVINILIGSVVAAIVLLVIFRSVKTMLVIGLSIPICVTASLASMKVFGYSINMVTLIGIGIGTGMIVDACIVVLENIFKYIQKGIYSKIDAVVLGTKEVIGPVFASILTTIAVFAPFVTLEGEIGKMAVQVSTVITVSLITSLLVSLTVIPIAAFNLVEVQKEASPFGVRLMGAFEKFLRFCLNRKWSFISIFVVLLVVSVYYLIAFVPKNYIPNVTPRELSIRYEIDENIDLELSKEILEEAAKKIQNVPGIDKVFYWTNENQSHMGRFYIHYLPTNEMPKSDEEVNEDVKNIVDETIPYSFFSMGQGQNDTAGQTEISVTSTSMSSILNVIPQIKEEVKLVGGVTGVESSVSDETKEWVIDFSKEQLQYYQLARQEVEQYVSLVLGGINDIDIKMNGKESTADIRFPQHYRESSHALYELPINEGVAVTLKDVSNLRQDPTARERERKDGQYEATLTIYHDVELKDRVVSQLETLISRSNTSDVQVAFAGREKQQSEGFQNLFIALIVALAVVFIILTFQFNRLRQPIIIFISLLFTGIGISLGFIITGRVFDIMAMIGVIMLAGIVVNNAIVLIDFINQHRYEYESIREAVVAGAKERMRPILTTTLTTIGGLIPMLIGGSNTSDFQTPIATAVVFGLLFSTLISLIFVPMLYEMFESRKRKVSKTRNAEEFVS